MKQPLENNPPAKYWHQIELPPIEISSKEMELSKENDCSNENTSLEELSKEVGGILIRDPHTAFQFKI